MVEVRQVPHGVGCRVQGVGCECAGCRVKGVGCRVKGVGCEGAGCRVKGVGCRVQGVGCEGAGCRVKSVGCRGVGPLHALAAARSRSTQGSWWGYLKSQFSRDLVNFGDKCPQNGSKTAPTAPRPHLGCPHEGSRVVVVCLGLGRGPPLPQGVSFQGLITSTRVCVGCGVWATRSGWFSHSNPLRRPRRARPDHQLPI